MKSVFKRIISLFLWTLLGLLTAMLMRFLCDSVYNLLHSRFGEAFPLYSPITEKADYARLNGVMSVISLSLALFLTVYISLLTDNERYENVIGKTDGLYDVKAALPLYEPRFIIGDIAASVFSSLAITIPLYFIPDRFFALTLLEPLTIPKTVCSFADGIGGSIIGAAIIASVMLLSHLSSLIFSLKVWRARWLTAFSE